MTISKRICVSKLKDETKAFNASDITISNQCNEDGARMVTLQFDLTYAYLLKAQKALETAVKKSLKKLLVNSFEKENTILFVGVGNAQFTGDSFGVNVSKYISQRLMTFSQNKERIFHFFYFNPDIRAKTGFDTIQIINMTIEKLNPTHVFLFDCFSTNELTRIGRVIQIRNKPLVPASGIKNYDGFIKVSDKTSIVSLGAVLLKSQNGNDYITMRADCDLLATKLVEVVAHAVAGIFD